MISKRIILIAAGLIMAVWTYAQPALVKQNGITRFGIDGKPYVMYGGELHNSTSSSESYMEEIGVWEQMKSGHFNTVIASSSWELVEPEEGKYDFSSVDHVIRNARRHGLKVVVNCLSQDSCALSVYNSYVVKM